MEYDGIVVRGRAEGEAEQERIGAVRLNMDELRKRYDGAPWGHRPETHIQNNGVLGVRVIAPTAEIAELRTRLEAGGFPVCSMDQFDAEMRDGLRDIYGRPLAD